ncbi:MAG: succinate dehydrogenase, partial [Candidatus Arcticimaribacter sp.]
MSGVIKSSLARKYAMALSGLFLVVFLLQHFTINLTSVFSEDIFNEISHFMGNNPLVQFVLQPILIFGVIFHFLMGFVLELKNRSARAQNYAQNKGSANSSWMSRNMIWSGAVILSFLVLHFIDFWFPEMNYKYIESLPSDPNRYFEEMVHKFVNPIRVVAYVVSFGFLMLHLLHGFSSSFQSVGLNNKYTRGFKTFTIAFSIVIP